MPLIPTPAFHSPQARASRTAEVHITPLLDRQGMCLLHVEARAAHDGLLIQPGTEGVLTCLILHSGPAPYGEGITLSSGIARTISILGVDMALCPDLADMPPVLTVLASPSVLLSLQAWHTGAHDGMSPTRAAARLLDLLASVVETARCEDEDMPPEHRAAHILATHLASPPPIDDLARICRTSRATLARRFRATYGTTMREYLRLRRLEAAYRLLEREGVSVTDAAYAVGYESLPSFSRAFHEHYGKAPVIVRNRVPTYVPPAPVGYVCRLHDSRPPSPVHDIHD